MARIPVELAPRAIRDLENYSESLQLRIARKIQTLSTAPEPRGTAVKRLQGFPFPAYRLRIGDYRAVFAVEEEKVVVLRIILTRKMSF